MSGWLEWLLRLLTGKSAETSQPQTHTTSFTTPPPVRRKVTMVTFNPFIPSEGNKRLTEVMGWHNPEELATAYIQDINHASHGYAEVVVADRGVVDGLPVKIDGFTYDPDEFVSLLRAGSGFHQPDTADYSQLVADYDLCGKVQRGETDEVWFFGPPYGGMHESCMAGPGAFWCNGPVVGNTDSCGRRFVMMGFSYERGVGEMLENMGHRVESILGRIYKNVPQERNPWQRFLRYEKTHPGQAEVGSVHFAPNSQHDYDWGNTTPVQSRCDNWYNYPNLEGAPRLVDCSEWGSGDIRLHHIWWLRHLGHVDGSTNGILNNWWAYILDPNNVP